MQIVDFTKILLEYPETVGDKKRLTALLRDLFPQETLQVSILIAAYDLGIVDDLKRADGVTASLIYRYTKRLVSDCGISHENALWSSSVWGIAFGGGVLNLPCEIAEADIPNLSTESGEIYEPTGIVEQTGPDTVTLTPNQKKAVITDSKRAVVIAGPGSGKTRVITERIGWLIDQKGAEPERILAITFATKAANEMRKRIQKRCPSKGNRVEVRTFHSLGLKILRENADLIGLDPNFEVANSTEKMRFLRTAYSSCQIRDDQEKARCTELITQLKNGMNNPKLQDIEEVFTNYNEELRKNNRIEFDDMIYLPVQLFRSSQSVVDSLKSRYDYVLIDEFQDVNDMQAQFLPYIVGDDTSLFVVGDDDQCIYEWRGAKPAVLKKYVKNSSFDKFYLEENFRSDKSIVSLSDIFIAHNTDRIIKRLLAKKSDKKVQVEALSAKAQFYRFSSANAEAAFCANEIKKLVSDRNCRYDEIAVLLRSLKTQGQAFKDAFNLNGIPYSSADDDNREYDEFIRVLLTINDFQRKGNLNKAVNFPSRILDNFLFSELKETYNLHELSIPEAFQYLVEHQCIFDESDLFRERYNLLDNLNKTHKSMTIIQVIARLLDFYQAEKDYLLENDYEKTNQIYHILEIAKEYEATGEQSDNQLKSFVDYLYAALQDETNVDLDSGAVNLLTCHKAKGLEFPVVFIPGVQVGVFPNDYFINTKVKLEEERRLFYVSMTRAMDVLYVTSYDDPLHIPNGSICKSFVSEIPNIIAENMKIN